MKYRLKKGVVLPENGFVIKNESNKKMNHLQHLLVQKGYIVYKRTKHAISFTTDIFNTSLTPILFDDYFEKTKNTILDRMKEEPHTPFIDRLHPYGFEKNNSDNNFITISVRPGSLVLAPNATKEYCEILYTSWINENFNTVDPDVIKKTKDFVISNIHSFITIKEIGNIPKGLIFIQNIEYETFMSEGQYISIPMEIMLEHWKNGFVSPTYHQKNYNQDVSANSYIHEQKQKVFTINDLKNGNCAVINDGTLDELNDVLKAAFPKDPIKSYGYAKYCLSIDKTNWGAYDETDLPTQSVNMFNLPNYKVETHMPVNMVDEPKKIIYKDVKIGENNIGDVTFHKSEILDKTIPGSSMYSSPTGPVHTESDPYNKDVDQNVSDEINYKEYKAKVTHDQILKSVKKSLFDFLENTIFHPGKNIMIVDTDGSYFEESRSFIIERMKEIPPNSIQHFGPVFNNQIVSFSYKNLQVTVIGTDNSSVFMCPDFLQFK